MFKLFKKSKPDIVEKKMQYRVFDEKVGIIHNATFRIHELKNLFVKAGD